MSYNTITQSIYSFFFKYYFSSPTELNNQLSQLIEEQFNALSAKCAETQQPMKPEILPKIIAIYLNAFHGPDRYKFIENSKNSNKLLHLANAMRLKIHACNL